MSDIRLAVDNTNVEAIPVGNLMDLGGELRRLADAIDAGEYGELRRVLIVLDGAPLRFQYSGQASSVYELIGLLDASKMLLFADDVIED